MIYLTPEYRHYRDWRWHVARQKELRRWWWRFVDAAQVLTGHAVALRIEE